jgi:hypothetical protein
VNGVGDGRYASSEANESNEAKEGVPGWCSIGHKGYKETAPTFVVSHSGGG